MSNTRLTFLPVTLSLVFSLAVGTPALGAQATSVAELHASMVGRWTGTLEYKDYSSPDRQVTLPTILEVSAREAGGVLIRSIFDDGPGKTVTDDDRFEFSADAATLDWSGMRDATPTVFRVVSVERDTAGAIRVVAEREGEDDNKPATLRETITVEPTRFTVRKDVRFSGGEFFVRHVFRMARER